MIELADKIAELAERARLLWRDAIETLEPPEEECEALHHVADMLERAYRAERLLRKSTEPRIGWETDEQRDERQDKLRAQAAALVDGES